MSCCNYKKAKVLIILNLILLLITIFLLIIFIFNNNTIPNEKNILVAVARNGDNTTRW